MSVLVTGGAGYIGSHTLISLLENGYEPVVIDNLCNSCEISLQRVEKITGKAIRFYRGDIRDGELLERIFLENKIESVIHFAGLKAVGESVSKPLAYYDNNIYGTLVLLDAMKKHGVKDIVFSSSATVYGKPASVPIREDFPLSCTNPYGRTKLFIEEILRDLYISDREWNIALLRYFNPVGSHKSGLIGEDPQGIPNNLMPYVAQTAIGKLPFVRVFGGDYDTPDGTGVRDYIHVLDLAEGHILALKKLESKPGVVTYNLGTGVGYSVLDMIRAFSKAVGREIPYQIVERRPGDIAACYGDPAYAKKEIGFEAKYGIDDMCADLWKWQTMNPNGYRS